MKYAIYTLTVEGPPADDAEAEQAIEVIEECVGMAESALLALVTERLGNGWTVEVRS